MGCMCMECIYEEILTDNNGHLFAICTHRKSDKFLKELEHAFDNCELGIIDDFEGVMQNDR